MYDKKFLVPVSLGNTGSVVKFFRNFGNVELVHDFMQHQDDEAILVLPGVSKFDNYINSLKNINIYPETVSNYILKNGSIIGICAGFQSLFDGSDEAPGIPGLGLISGRSVSIASSEGIPQVGWVKVNSGSDTSIGNYYFNNSYAINMNDHDYKGQFEYFHTKTGRYLASIRLSKKIAGFQYHPEQSGKLGLNKIYELLQN